MIKNYFRLFEECYLVKGKNSYCIYNLINKTIFNIELKIGQVIELLENNISIIDAINEVDINSNYCVTILNKIKDNSLGNYYDKKIFIEKLNSYPKWIDSIFFKTPPQINRAFIELNNSCDSDCKFCNSDNYVRRFSCLGCSKTNITVQKLNIEKLKENINILKFLNVNELIFTGGNIFIDWKKALEVIKYSIELGFKNITIIFGSKDISDNILEILNNLDVKLLIQRYINTENKDYLLSDPLILKLNEKYHNIKYTKIILLDYENKSLSKYIYDKNMDKFKNESIFIDYLIDFSNISEQQKADIKYISSTSIDEFSIKNKFNSCINGTITINCDGSITTCPKLKEYKLSESKDLIKNLQNIYLDKYWNLNLDKIDNCKDCQYRYACNDCRYIELKYGGNIERTTFCNYIK